MVIYLSLLVALIGLLIHLLVADGRFQQTGLGMFLVGLLAFLLQVPSHWVGVIK